MVVLSDLHAGSPQVHPPALRTVAEAIRAAEPDLVLFLGDFVDDEVAAGEEVSPERAGRALGPLEAPLGVFGVLGNHDWRYDGERVRKSMEAAGIRILENEAVELNGFWLAIAGDRATARAQVDQTLAAVPDGAPVLLATHSPDIFPEVPRRVSLTLAGHTHGGQVKVPLLRRLWIPSRFGARYADAVVEEDGKLMFVHPGVGTSAAPVRLGAPPEVSVLRLRARP